MPSAPSGHWVGSEGGNGATRRWGRARVRFTAAADGNLQVRQPADVLAARRAAVMDRPWTWLHQVHGNDVVVVREPGEQAGAEADAAATNRIQAVLAIHTADCVPLALVSDRAVAAVHAGWRGVQAGVVEAAAAAVRQLGGHDLRAVLGPCIRPECYEFGPADLADLVARYGPAVQATTAQGTPALDMPALVGAALRRAGIDQVDDVGICTGCDDGYFSHRVRGDVERQAMLVWLEE